jgi:hypothetical protein
MPPTANDIDLTVLANVKNWVGSVNTTDDQSIQDCITAFSAYVLRVTGRGPSDGSNPTFSPFVEPVNYNEFYDGSGSRRQFVRNWPITAVSLVQVGLIQIPASGGIGQAGYVIDGNGKSLSMRDGSGGGISGQPLTVGFFTRPGRYYGFSEGIQNVNIQYTAGFSEVPFDLEMVARKTVGLNYKRKDWIGQKSRAMAQGAGTISYNDWEMDKQDVRTLEYYQRRATV